jgi:2-polyprenyl-3-methyl-5-hydroxy-6-metoxy-1,4-benzoquinol methylase
MPEFVVCDQCGSSLKTPLFNKLDSELSSPEKFIIVKCQNCGLMYLDPRPTKDEIGSFYPKNYYSYQAGEPAGFSNKLARIARLGAPGYKNQKTASKLIYKIFHGRIVTFPFQQDGKLLDIGCGSGVFIKELNSLGWDSYGTEIDKVAVESAKKAGLKVFCGELADALFPENFFDVVTIKHVIEHVHSPKAVLSEINRIMKTNGTLVITTPNFACYETHVFGRFWSSFDVPRHIYFFSFETLQRLLKSNGFEIEKVDWLNYTITNSLRHSLRDMRVIGHKSRGAILSAFFKWTIIQGVLYLFSRKKGERFGSVINVYAKKREKP